MPSNLDGILILKKKGYEHFVFFIPIPLGATPFFIIGFAIIGFLAFAFIFVLFLFINYYDTIVIGLLTQVPTFILVYTKPPPTILGQNT